MRVSSVRRCRYVRTILSVLLFGLFVNRWLLCIVSVALEKFLDTFLSQQQSILVFILFLARRRNLVSVIIAHEDVDGHKGRGNILFEELNPREVLEPRMFFDLYDSVLSPQSLSRLSLNHLSIQGVTLLTKSAASMDQPGGISSAFI